MSITVPHIEANGIVGAGGAGFPTHVKMKATAEYFILNAAECEPLLHKDKEILLHYTQDLLQGIITAAQLVGAKKCIIGIKDKYIDVINKIEKIKNPNIEIKLLRDIYPAGDEFILVYDTTGRVVPPGGLPLDVDCIVNNVETILNIIRNRPVTEKYLTVTGAVKNPQTLCVPLGISVQEVINAAGGTTVSSYEIILNGVMMGKLATEADTPVTKTTGGIYVFPQNHPLLKQYKKDYKTINRIGRSACDQCSFCTELCPRYLLGHPIEPHKAMRALSFTMDQASLIVGTTYCCECNICSMIACPEDLDPKNVCVQNKRLVKEKGWKWEKGDKELKPHPLNEERRTPMKRLIYKLGLQEFENKGPLKEGVIDTGKVKLPLKQHVGASCVPTVKIGSKIKKGDVIGLPPSGQLGAVLHASISGTVTKVDSLIEIQK